MPLKLKFGILWLLGTFVETSTGLYCSDASFTLSQTSCYKIETSILATFDEARSHCQSTYNDGDLIQITTDHLYDVIKAEIDNMGIGTRGYRVGANGTFDGVTYDVRWLNGDVCCSIWYPGEPNSPPGDLAVALITSIPGYLEGRTSLNMNLICEVPTVLELGDPCTTTEQCSAIGNASCTNNGTADVCACSSQFVEDGGNCRPIGLGDQCVSSRDCEDISGGDCNTTSQTCECTDEYRQYNGTCIPEETGSLSSTDIPRGSWTWILLGATAGGTVLAVGIVTAMVLYCQQRTDTKITNVKILPK